MPNPISTAVPVDAALFFDYKGQTIKAQPYTATWVSSDPTVATVDARGVVTPVAPGTASITAYVSGTLPDGYVFTDVPVMGVVTVTGVLNISMSFN